MIDANPEVCLQVEEVIDDENWSSVVVVGDAEKITDASDRNNREMKYQFVAFMDQPNGAAVLSLIYIGESAPLNGEALRANCGHANGYFTCLNGEEWVRIP